MYSATPSHQQYLILFAFLSLQIPHQFLMSFPDCSIKQGRLYEESCSIHVQTKWWLMSFIFEWVVWYFCKHLFCLKMTGCNRLLPFLHFRDYWVPCLVASPPLPDQQAQEAEHYWTVLFSVVMSKELCNPNRITCMSSLCLVPRMTNFLNFMTNLKGFKQLKK